MATPAFLIRQAGTAWLLSLLKHAGSAPEVRAAAAEVQRALLALLADSNEETQSLAAKGLSLLFDKCDEATQVTDSNRQ